MVIFLGLLALSFASMFAIAGASFLLLWKFGFLPTLKNVPFPFERKRKIAAERSPSVVAFMWQPRQGALVLGLQSAIALYAVAQSADSRNTIFQESRSSDGTGVKVRFGPEADDTQTSSTYSFAQVGQS